MLREIANAVCGRIRSLVHRRRLERDLQDELAFHLAMRAERLRGEGLDAGAAAAAAAERRFGNVMRLREACRSVWTLGPLERFAQDLRYGARMLRRSPSLHRDGRGDAGARRRRHDRGPGGARPAAAARAPAGRAGPAALDDADRARAGTP